MQNDVNNDTEAATTGEASVGETSQQDRPAEAQAPVRTTEQASSETGAATAQAAPETPAPTETANAQTTETPAAQTTETPAATEQPTETPAATEQTTETPAATEETTETPAATEQTTETPAATEQTAPAPTARTEPRRVAKPPASPAAATPPPAEEKSGEIDFAAILERFEQEQAVYHAGDLVEGKVVGVSERGALVDFGYKSEGIIPAEENVEGEEPLNVGDSVEVVIKSIHA